MDPQIQPPISNPNEFITSLVDKITNDPSATKIITDIAQQINIYWFEWALKVGIATLIFLLFKDFIYCIFNYIRLRSDKYVGIGTLVKYNNVIGRIKSYDFKFMVIETTEGFVRIPLEEWLSNHWTVLKQSDFNLSKTRKENEQIELKIFTLQNEIKELKNKTSGVITPNDDKGTK